MANAMIPPTQPNNMRPPVNPIPTPVNALIPPVPMPPPPTGTGLGFAQWAMDPANAMKVMPSMTAPDKPLQPGAQSASAAPPAFTPMASVMPPKPTPMASVMPPQMPQKPNPLIPPGQAQLDTDTQKLRDLQTQGAGLNKIQNPLLRGLARAGDIVAPFLIGGGAAAIPGTTLHNRYLQGQQAGVIAGDQQAQTNALDTQKTQLEIQNLQNPQKEYTPLQTDNGYQAFDKSSGTTRAVLDGNGQPVSQTEKPKPAENPQQGYAAAITDAITRGVDPSTDPHVMAWKSAIDGLAKQAKPDTPEQQYLDEYQRIHKGSTIAEATRAYAKDHQSPERPDTGTWQLGEDNTGKPIMWNSKTGETRANTTGISKPGTLEKTQGKYQGIIQSAAMAHQLQAEGDKGNAEADPALALLYFKAIKGPDGSGIRFTQTEQNMILGARSSSGDLEALGQKVMGGGGKFTPAQRANAVKVVDMYAAAAQRQMAGDGQPAQPGSAPPKPLGARPNNLVPPAKLGGAPQPPAGSRALTDGGVTYHIPANQVAAFKKDHPNAR